MLTDDMLYLIVTGQMRAVVDIGLGAVGEISQNQYQIELQKNEQKISPATVDELAQKKDGVAIQRQDIDHVDVNFPPKLAERLQFDPSLGPTIVIQAKREKYRLQFRSRSEEDITPFIEALMQPFIEPYNKKATV